MLYKFAQLRRRPGRKLYNMWKCPYKKLQEDGRFNNIECFVCNGGMGCSYGMDAYKEYVRSKIDMAREPGPGMKGVGGPTRPGWVTEAYKKLRSGNLL